MRDLGNGRDSREPIISLIGVVDDDESVRDALSSLVRAAGYRCALFPSAEAFLDSGQLDKTDCALLDVRMPGMNGLELQARLRQMGSSIPVIFITAHIDDQLRDRALRDGASAFFGKPFNDEALLSSIRTALDGSHDQG
jgi:FixJ family two-component response regulator